MFLQEASEIQGSQKSFKLPHRNSSDIVVTTLSSRVNYEENRRHSDSATVLFHIKRNKFIFILPREQEEESFQMKSCLIMNDHLQQNSVCISTINNEIKL